MTYDEGREYPNESDVFRKSILAVFGVFFSTFSSSTKVIDRSSRGVRQMSTNPYAGMYAAMYAPQPYLHTFSSRRTFKINCENSFLFIKSGKPSQSKLVLIISINITD
uniref:Uncharacterized protein n=1 Tax=Glossina austeni TaxID=7395 RepID=A0A1A9V905_GLOAU